MPSQTFTSSGSWSAPANLAGPPKVEAWGPGANGQNHSIAAGGGSGGGEYAAEPSLGGVTPGSTTLTITIGGGGSSTSTTVTGGSVTVTAHAGGVGASGSGGAGGTGSTNTTHHDGGAGAAQSGGTGGGGGGSGGSSSAGNPGSGSTGGAAVTGGGAGGNGGSPGSGGGSPGGGGGGASSGSGGAGAGGQVIVTWTVASTYTGQVSAKGRAAAVRGSGKGTAGAKYVAFPSHFTPPVRPAKGAQAAARGHAEGSPGAPRIAPPPFVISPFTLPVRPARGATGRRGSGRGSPGAAYVSFPSAFQLPRKSSRGAGNAVRGHSASSPGARFVLIQTSPFTLPKGPARGRMSARRGIWSAGSATGKGAPFVPRTLIISIASAAGRDDYGNPFVQGIQVSQGLIQGQVIAAESIVKGILAPGAVDDFTLNAVQINSGTVVASDIIMSATSGGAFAYSSGGTITQVFTASGTWKAPAGVTSVKAECWGAGGGGGGTNGALDPGGGGGGGEYARENTLAVTPGTTYTFTAGTAGTGGGSGTGNGTAGGNTTFAGDSVTVTAHGGSGGRSASSFAFGGAGGTGSTNSIHFGGGSGSDAALSGNDLGSGGGSGGTGSAGNPGNPDGSGAVAVVGGGPGGPFDNSPVTGPGGGGGGYGVAGGANGWQGQIFITYTSSSAQLIASIAGAATTDPVAGVNVPEGMASDHYTVSSNAAVPGTPSGGGVFWYDGTALWFKGVSGTPVKLATT